MSTGPLTLGPAPPGTRSRPSPGSAQWLHLARQARLLSWFSLAWMGVEGTVAIAAGLVAGSIALVGFGIDSAIEGLASVIILWRFSGPRTLSEASEGRAQRAVSVSFFLLAPYVAAEAVRDLVGQRHPETSWVGVGLAVSSFLVMPVLGEWKRRLGERLGSAATTGEGAQNMLCAYLAAVLLVGLLGNALFGLWWLDLAVALLIAGLAVREGVEAWRGESCCAAPVVPAPAEDVGCADQCCAAGP